MTDNGIGGTIGKLYKIFTTFFSMKDLESEFTEVIRIEVFGNGDFAENFARLLYPKAEHYVNLLNEETDIKIVESSTFSLFFPDSEKINESDLTSLIAKIPPHSRKRAAFFIPQEMPEDVKTKVDKLLESMAMYKAITFSSKEDIVKKLIQRIGNKAFASARTYPGIRDILTSIQIQKISRENAGIAFISSVPANIPIIGTIIALFAVAGETLILTANQIRLCLRIAGIYGYKLDFYARMSELWPVLAGALGWKTLAKAVVGLLPAAGAILKSSIAYAGTVAAGKGAQIYYRDGKSLTKNDIKKIYENGKKNFSVKVKDILKHTKKREITNEQIKGLIENHMDTQEDGEKTC